MKNKQNVGLDEGSDSDDSPSVSTSIIKDSASNYEPLPPFKDLYPNTDIVRCLKEFGPNIIPLQLIGMMMNYAGNHMLHYIATVLKRKIFYPMHKVISVQLLASGEILTTTKRTDCVIKRNGGNIKFLEQEVTVTFRSKAIVLSNGGVMGLPETQLKQWFPSVPKEKYILADHFLRRDYYRSILNRIKEQKLKKIVIVGGSHSGFSCAWLLFNGPATYSRNLSINL